MKLGTIFCVVCGVEIDIRAYTDEDRRSDVYFRLYRCPECRVDFWEPRRMPGAGFYEQDAEAVSAAALARHTVGSRRLWDNHQAFFTRHPSGPGSILDIGCGDGHFLEAAQLRGFQVVGMDLDAKALEVARERGLVRLHCGTLDTLALQMKETEERYDFVTFFEVLEHQPDPNEFVHIAERLLRPGGIIAGSVPNRNCFHTTALRASDRPPYHFTRWSQDSLQGFLERLGFRDVTVMDVGFGYYLLSLFEGLNMRTKRAVLAKTSETALKTSSVEEVAILSSLSPSRRALVRILKKGKAALFAPWVMLESGVGRMIGKGKCLYFEGRLSP